MEKGAVSVVIPTFNRAHLLPRTLASVLAQRHAPLEVIVVDDGSTDDTEAVVLGTRDARVRYVRLAEKANGAVARNLGIERASGAYVALLDSDDEWLPDHLASKVRLLQETGAKGAFGAYLLAWSAGTVEHACLPPPPGMAMAEYILSGFPGNTHTSTLVLDRDAMLEVMFDPSLEKHQDWDLAIRFAERHPLVCDATATVRVHPEADARMSYRMRHQASAEFMRRYEDRLTARTRARVYALYAHRTIRSEGRNAHFADYMRRAMRHWTAAAPRDRLVLAALAVPGVDRLFMAAGTAFTHLQRRRRAARAASTAGVTRVS